MRDVVRNGVHGVAAVVPRLVGGVLVDDLDGLYDELPIKASHQHDAIMAFKNSTRLQCGPADKRVLSIHAAAAVDVAFVAPCGPALLRAIREELHTHGQVRPRLPHALRLLIHVGAQLAVSVVAVSVPPAEEHYDEHNVARKNGEAGEARELGDRGLLGVQVSLLLGTLVMPRPVCEPAQRAARPKETASKPTKDVEDPLCSGGVVFHGLDFEAPLLQGEGVAPDNGHAHDHGLWDGGLRNWDGIARLCTVWDSHLDGLAVGPCSKEGVARPCALRHQCLCGMAGRGRDGRQHGSRGSPSLNHLCSSNILVHLVLLRLCHCEAFAGPEWKLE
mmetsp:Transcript_154716/g.496024  ORF Transcript_154716/g.496024 Transcript_154716/m.496024 type:complete len:332 (-) Transcript_154716:58-1053(-)